MAESQLRLSLNIVSDDCQSSKYFHKSIRYDFLYNLISLTFISDPELFIAL